MKNAIVWAGIFGITGIAFGALGAHALKQVLQPEQLNSFETGVRYQMYHALFLLAVDILDHQQLIKNTKWITGITVVGIFFFSFSIYLLNLQDVFGVSLRFLGPITPIGGLLLISSWLLLLIGVNKAR
jgi:uncharacterized membrane protein YgdD (TMEM256/DUF423 family)